MLWVTMAGMHAWFDISAGVAGDMLLGSLLDAGADAAAVEAAIEAVAPGSVRLETEAVVRGGQRATKARVRVLVEDPPHRRWATIRATLTTANLAEPTRERALRAFGLLADAEARAHGISPDDVHFHEVGALDSLADVVGTCEALRTLGVTAVTASPVRLGAGRVRAAHGDIPVPVPAVAELAIGWQVYATPERDADHSHGHTHDGGHEHEHEHEHGEHHHGEHHHHGHGSDHDTPAVVTTQGSVGELATPTGLALVRALADTCGPLPAFTVTGVGVGAGGKDFVGWPNVVRVVVGQPLEDGHPEPAAAHPSAAPGRAPIADRGRIAASDHPGRDLSELRANVDDFDPRLWPGVLDALIDAGAVDAWLVPILMKKGRPGFTLHALAPESLLQAVTSAILTRTSSLGVRATPVSRTVAQRHWTRVEVVGEQITVKVGSLDGVILHAEPEFDSLAAAAARLQYTEYDLAQRAVAAIAAAGLLHGQPLPAGLDAEE